MSLTHCRSLSIKVLSILCLLSMAPEVRAYNSNQSAKLDNTNPFQNKWRTDYGDVTITQCKAMKCKIEIGMASGISTCWLKGELTVLSPHAAIFHMEDSDNNGFLPINLSLEKYILTVTIPEESRATAREYCDKNGFFEGKYIRADIPLIYKPSFNCNQAKTKIELAICHSKELAYADTVLAELYAQLKAKYFSSLISQQKEWIKERDLCTNAIDLNECLSERYRARILTLQQNIINNSQQFEKINTSLPYNFDYLLTKRHYDLFQDPPLQHYLKATLPKEIFEEIIRSSFYSIQGEDYHDNSLIMVHGGTPGLYTICEGALVLTKEHQTWLAYIKFNDALKLKKQIIVISPQNANLTAMPAPLKKWVEKLLPYMDSKEVVYKKLFPSGTI